MSKQKTPRERDIKLNFYVTKKEEEVIKRKALNFQSLSDYLRRIAVSGKVYLPAPSIDREALIELTRIGNNINQIAKRVNQAEANIFQKSTKRELSESLDVLIKALDTKIFILDKKVYDSKSE
jgi:hypothetical protein